MNYQIREMTDSEYPLLDTFLYEAIFIPDGTEAPPRSVTASPDLQVYVSGFGTQEADKCLMAEAGGRIVGAVWVRIMNDYGHIDDETPSLAVSVYKEYRGIGIGTALMKSMCSLLKENNYRQVSLSVQKANYAAKMYLDLGFQVVRENQEEYIMVKYLEC